MILILTVLLEHNTLLSVCKSSHSVKGGELNLHKIITSYNKEMQVRINNTSILNHRAIRIHPPIYCNYVLKIEQTIVLLEHLKLTHIVYWACPVRK